MRKRQDQFTFEEAKEYTKSHLQDLIDLAESIDERFPYARFYQHAINLSTIKELVGNTSERCLSKSQIEQVDIFRQHLIKGLAELEPKLLAFWNLYQDILQILRSKKMRSISGYAPSEVISSMMPRIKKADDLAYDTFGSTQRNIPATFLSITSLLLIHVIRVESIEYAISRQLEDAIKTFNLTKYDIPEICSVYSKIPKARTWKSDVRAVRDAIAHGHFTITINKNDWRIEFNNTEEGYNFVMKFDRKEFIKFFDLHTMLYKMQISLLEIVELLPTLVTHFYQK